MQLQSGFMTFMTVWVEEQIGGGGGVFRLKCNTITTCIANAHNKLVCTGSWMCHWKKGGILEIFFNQSTNVLYGTLSFKSHNLEKTFIVNVMKKCPHHTALIYKLICFCFFCNKTWFSPELFSPNFSFWPGIELLFKDWSLQGLKNVGIWTEGNLILGILLIHPTQDKAHPSFPSSLFICRRGFYSTTSWTTSNHTNNFGHTELLSHLLLASYILPL